MTPEQKVRLLKSFSVVSNIDDNSLASISKYFRYKTFSPKTTIFLEKSRGDEMYFIHSGLIRIFRPHENGKETTIALRFPGEIVGEMSLIEDEPRSASAETLQDTSLFVLTKKDYLSVIQDYPSIGLNILKILSRRLREDLHLQEMISLQTLKDRTMHILKTLSSNSSGANVSLTHEQLSILINATQPRVTEALHSLQENRMISISRKNIRVF
jgi:CRP-like cAMP-binding protein